MRGLIRVLLIGAVALGLGGCVAYPAGPYYGGYGYAPAPYYGPRVHRRRPLPPRLALSGARSTFARDDMEDMPVFGLAARRHRIALLFVE
jgi:hypothetical protein